MAFSFGFSGDDIDIEDSELDQQDRGQGNAIPATDEEDVALPKMVEARRHEMGEWVRILFFLYPFVDVFLGLLWLYCSC